MLVETVPSWSNVLENGKFALLTHGSISPRQTSFHTQLIEHPRDRWAVYTSEVVQDRDHCLEVMGQMEKEFQAKNESFFIAVLQSEASLVLRVHAVCILADLGGGESLPVLSDVLLRDPDPLVRHEAAFSLGQMGLQGANHALESAVRQDKEAIVRHEAVAALGSIGSQECRPTLELALRDNDELVRNSARTSLFNLDFLRQYPTNSSAKERAPRP